MTLHWWMHWFWITRPVAVAAQLIFLLAAVQAVPLPASTLDPEAHNNHHSRTPLATSWSSGNEDSYENDKPTSVYVEQQRQTVVYEDSPVWSNSPDIEEPFYPTTASSDRLSNRDFPTENIPVTPKSISDDESNTNTYLSRSYEKAQLDYVNPTEFSSQYFSDQSLHTGDIVQNFDAIDKDISQYPYKSKEDAVNLQERITASEEIHSSTQVNVIIRPTAPKNIDYSIQQNSHVSFNTESNDKSFQPPPDFSLDEKTTNINDSSHTHSRKVSQRLVIRDLSNLSEPTFSSVASHGSNSTDIENTSRPSARGSKAIGSFPFSSPSFSVNEKQEHISPGKIDDNQNEEKIVHVIENKENQTILRDLIRNNGSKTLEHNDTHSSANTTQIKFNSSVPTLDNISENERRPLGDRRPYLESDSSKLAPELYNKSAQILNSTSKKSPNASRDGSFVSSSNTSLQSIPSRSSTVSALDSEMRNVHSSESSVPFDSNISQRITTLSDTEESGNLTPVHSREFVGRSASLSHDSETTVEPSVAPVSRSRVAASPQEISHSGLDAASITGIALGIVVFAGLTGAVSFILYRRRYLNKPQTLNDKCSNPDSSGYIDDSTLRDNSEEMYSLDNDSFLNSLEAMTIQNYWTDNQETCWRQNHP